jgi:hypothetical protein
MIMFIHEQGYAESVMKRLWLKASPEWVVAAALLAVVIVLQAILRAPVEWSSAGPVLGHIGTVVGGYIFVATWLWLALYSGKGKQSKTEVVRKLVMQVSDAACFALVLSLSLYIKLLVPLLRPTLYDRQYEAIDRVLFAWLEPLINWRTRAIQVHWIDSLYFLAFFSMFLFSFVTHNLRGRAEFRRVFLATLLVQGVGGVLYLAAPALGPFLYHPSANPVMGATEHYFYLVRQNELAGGVRWLSANAGRYIMCGLAAMPSLHAAGSFVFLYYAWRVRWLFAIYVPAFGWILFGAMATRWHYGIDLIAGLGLACSCIAMAEWWMRVHERAEIRSTTLAEEIVAIAD